jgi:hypothetical protein
MTRVHLGTRRLAEGAMGVVFERRLAAPCGKSPAIAIRRRCCGGARGRDRTLRLPAIRLRPRTFLLPSHRLRQGYAASGGSSSASMMSASAGVVLFVPNTKPPKALANLAASPKVIKSMRNCTCPAVMRYWKAPGSMSRFFNHSRTSEILTVRLSSSRTTRTGYVTGLFAPKLRASKKVNGLR